jgi:hypothetical protein
MGCVCAFTLVRCVALDTQSDGSCGTAVSDTNLLGQRASHAICDSRLLQLVRGCGAQDNVRDSLTASKCFMRVNSTSFRKCVRVHECERIAHSLVCSRTDVHSRVRNECGDGEAKHSILRRHRSHTTLSLSTTPLAPVLTVTKRVIFFLNFCNHVWVSSMQSCRGCCARLTALPWHPLACKRRSAALGQPFPAPCEVQLARRCVCVE